MIKCLIFDCDDTLVDSEYLCNKALAIKLEEYGISEDTQSLVKRYRGRKFANTVKDLEEIHNQKFSDDFISSYRLLVSELFKSELQAIPEVESSLKEIALPKCVASNAPLIKMQESLTLTGLIHYFSGNLFSAYEVQSWKPDPGLFLHAAKNMGFEAEECAVIEDSVVGIEAALAAKMNPIYFSPSGHKHGCAKVESISKMSQLVNLVTK